MPTQIAKGTGTSNHQNPGARGIRRALACLAPNPLLAYFMLACLLADTLLLCCFPRIPGLGPTHVTSRRSAGVVAFFLLFSGWLWLTFGWVLWAALTAVRRVSHGRRWIPLPLGVPLAAVVAVAVLGYVASWGLCARTGCFANWAAPEPHPVRSVLSAEHLSSTRSSRPSSPSAWRRIYPTRRHG